MPDTQPAPAIRWTDYMNGREEMDATYLIGPYESVNARNTDLTRLSGLPLGAPEYNGGQTFMAATMADKGNGWFDQTVDPAQVAKATTQRGFHAAFAGYDDEPDQCEPHPDQIGLFS